MKVYKVIRDRYTSLIQSLILITCLLGIGSCSNNRAGEWQDIYREINRNVKVVIIPIEITKSTINLKLILELVIQNNSRHIIHYNSWWSYYPWFYDHRGKSISQSETIVTDLPWGNDPFDKECLPGSTNNQIIEMTIPARYIDFTQGLHLSGSFIGASISENDDQIDFALRIPLMFFKPQELLKE